MHGSTAEVSALSCVKEQGQADSRGTGQALGYEKSIDGTWHHCEDGKTLQEIETILHKRFTHKGGISILNNN